MGEEHKDQKTDVKEHLNNLEGVLELYLVKKAPPIPKGWKEFIVNIAPWLVIFGLVILVPRLITLFEFITMIAGSTYGAAVGMGFGPVYYLSIILAIIALVLDIMGLPGLFARRKRGWNFVFYSTLVGMGASLTGMNIAGLAACCACILFSR